MTQFSFTSPAPGTGVFQAGQPENVNSVITALNDLKTFLNGTNLDTTNLAAAAGITGAQLSSSAGILGSQLSASAAIADTQLASSVSATYRKTAEAYGRVSGATTGTTYVFGAGALRVLTDHTANPYGPLYLDPADFAVTGRTTKYRLRVALGVDATAPTSTFTFGLYPVTAVAGATNNTSYTLGAVTAGSTVAFAAPTASTLAQANSGDFTAPAAGYYLLGVAVSVASQVANSGLDAYAYLQVRSV